MQRIQLWLVMAMVWAGCGPLPVPVLHLDGIDRPLLALTASHGTPGLSPQTFTLDIHVQSEAHVPPRGPWDCFALPSDVQVRVGGREAQRMEDGAFETTYDMFTGAAAQRCIPPRFRVTVPRAQLDDAMDAVVLVDGETVFNLEVPTLSRPRTMTSGTTPLVVHPGETVDVAWSHPQDVFVPPGVTEPGPFFLDFFQRGEQTGSWPAVLDNGTWSVAVPEFAPLGAGTLSAGLVAVFPPVTVCPPGVHCACTMMATGATLPLEVRPY